MDKKEFVKDRLGYIQCISSSLRSSQCALLPSPAEERSLEEALTHVVHVASSAPTEGTFICDSSSSGRTNDRKQCLKNIFDQLCWMERERLYDPPGDDIIGHYLLVKKYMRAILAFNLGADADEHVGDFQCSSPFYTRHHAEELLELNRQLEDLSEFLLGKDIDDSFTLAPLMGRKESNESFTLAPSIISGSNEKSYLYYCHKFLLASIDMKNSDFAHCPPIEDEKRSYVHVLDNIAAPLLRTADVKNIYSDELFHLYLETIYREMVNIERHLSKIKGWIKNNLSFPEEWWESMGKQLEKYDIEEEDDFIKFTKDVTDTCEVSNEDLADYISQIERLCTIAQLLVAFVSGRSVDNGHLFLLRSFSKVKPTGWEIVHALSLFKHGPFVGSVFQDQPILHNPLKLVPLEAHHQVERKHEHIFYGKGQDENVVILDKIINDLRCIGDLDIMLDQEEKKLARKIWGNVASSTHFFVSAKTYQQRRHMTRVLELSVGDGKETIPLNRVKSQQSDLSYEMRKFAHILDAYKVGLRRKLKALNVSLIAAAVECQKPKDN